MSSSSASSSSAATSPSSLQSSEAQPSPSSSSASSRLAPEDEAAPLSLSSASSGNKVWFGNLGGRASEHQLLTLAKPFGAISKLDLVYGLNARGERVPRGYAFVTFSDAASAARAVRALDGAVMAGRTLRVKAANPSKSELRALMGTDLAKKRKGPTLEEARSRSRAAADSERAAKIRALEAQLSAIEAKEDKFHLAIVDSKKTKKS